MDNFNLRVACNELVTELKKSVSQKNVIKLSIDIQLPDHYIKEPVDLFNAIRTLALYLSGILVNGIINIEISMLSSHGKSLTALIQISGSGLSRATERDLTRVKQVIENYDFKILTRSVPDQTTFELSCTLETAHPHTNASHLPFTNKKVLIVEDNEINAMVFSSFLDDWGCENLVAINGAEAVSHAHEGGYDIILMDIRMPVLNGNLATRKIREFSSIPIIALTASMQENDIKDAIEAGANEYLLKPISSNQLFQVLSKYL